MRRAVISVASNIVEGFRRQHLRDSLNFYNIANGSLEELKYQMLVAHDLKYIDERIYQRTINLCEEVSKMLNSWIRSQKNNINPKA